MKKQTYDILRTSSVRVLCELFTKLLQHSTIEGLLTKEQFNRWRCMRVENEYLAMFYLGLLVSGCRVRELLRVKFSDVSVFGQLYISGSKGSGSRSITIPGYEAIMLDFRDREVDPFYCLSYSYIYRSFIRFGLTIESSTGERRKVAHSLRYQAISGMYDQTGELQKVADIIGHRTKKTTDYYLRQGKGKLKVKKSK